MNHEQTDTLFGPWKQSASGVQNLLLAHNSIHAFAREKKLETVRQNFIKDFIDEVKKFKKRQNVYDQIGQNLL